MPITFEEITGEVMPERGGEQPRQESRESQTPGQLEEKIRAALVREQRRSQRLCDR